MFCHFICGILFIPRFTASAFSRTLSHSPVTLITQSPVAITAVANHPHIAPGLCIMQWTTHTAFCSFFMPIFFLRSCLVRAARHRLASFWCRELISTHHPYPAHHKAWTASVTHLVIANPSVPPWRFSPCLLPDLPYSFLLSSSPLVPLPIHTPPYR